MCLLMLVNNDIIRWAAKKGIPKTAAYAIYNKLIG